MPSFLSPFVSLSHPLSPRSGLAPTLDGLFFDFSLGRPWREGNVDPGENVHLCPSTSRFGSVRTFVRTWFHSECDASKIDVDIYWMRNDVAEQGTTPTLLNPRPSLPCLFLSFLSSPPLPPILSVHRSLGSLVRLRVTRIIPNTVRVKHTRFDINRLSISRTRC